MGPLEFSISGVDVPSLDMEVVQLAVDDFGAGGPHVEHFIDQKSVRADGSVTDDQLFTFPQHPINVVVSNTDSERLDQWRILIGNVNASFGCHILKSLPNRITFTVAFYPQTSPSQCRMVDSLEGTFSNLLVRNRFCRLFCPPVCFCAFR